MLSLSNEKSFALAEKSPDEKTFALAAAIMLVTGSYWSKFTVGHLVYERGQERRAAGRSGEPITARSCDQILGWEC